MLKAPALIVRHRRFTLVVGVLLACLMAIASIGVSIELYRADAATVLVLAPQVFVLIAAGLLKLAYDRWATSLVCLSHIGRGAVAARHVCAPHPVDSRQERAQHLLQPDARACR